MAQRNREQDNDRNRGNTGNTPHIENRDTQGGPQIRTNEGQAGRTSSRGSNLSDEDRRKGGVRSASSQQRDEMGRFGGEGKGRGGPNRPSGGQDRDDNS
jgi:hypothetical protein